MPEHAAPSPSSRATPTFTPRQYVGAAITLVLAAVWVVFEIQGDPAPAVLGQGLVVGLALVAGSAASDRPGRGDSA